MRNLSKIAGTVLGSATLAALPPAAGATVIFENESVTPNDTFPGQNINAGDTFIGSNNGGSDPIDFLHYTGLPVGNSFDVQVHRDTCCHFQTILLDAAIYSGQSTTVNPPSPIDLDYDETKHLTGLVPGTGELTVGVKLLSAGAFEGYQVALTVAPPAGVPQPATLALLAAGLTGLLVLRRKMRV
jgi:hypothetical protein